MKPSDSELPVLTGEVRRHSSELCKNGISLYERGIAFLMAFQSARAAGGFKRTPTDYRRWRLDLKRTREVRLIIMMMIIIIIIMMMTKSIMIQIMWLDYQFLKRILLACIQQC